MLHLSIFVITYNLIFDFLSQMEIPGSGIVNRYIAAQGPLPATCTDFWQMVCEQHTSLLVMLTMKNERGRVRNA